MSNPEDPTLPVEPPSVPPAQPPAAPPAPPPVPPYTPPPPAPPYGSGGPPDPPFVPPPPASRPTGLIVGLGVAVVALAAVAFFVGRSTVKQGPKTLLAAFTQAQQGKLPCGAPAAGGPAVGGGNGAGNGGGGGAGGRGFGGGAFLGRICNGGANGGAPGGGNGGANGGNGGAAGGGGLGRFGGGAGGAGGLFGGPGATTGTVVSVNGDQLTIQTRAGNLTITLPAGVNITKTTAGAVGDITNGETIIVTSATDASGKRTASRIFILPAGTAAPGTTPPSTATG